MKRPVLLALALAAPLLTAGHVLAQKAKSATPPPAAPTQHKMVRVATINGVEENRRFQANVQVMQAQRQALIELNGRMNAETDTKKKAEMKKELEAKLAKLNQDNATMEKTYGFSLARNYTLDIETAHIYMLVTDEEAAKFEKEQQAKAAKAAKKK